MNRFEGGDWAGLAEDAETRLLLYGRTVAEVVVRVGRLSLWQPLPFAAVRRRYAGAIEDREDRGIAETFYNSVIRRLAGTFGVDRESEFLDLTPARFAPGPRERTIRISGTDTIAGAMEAVLASTGLKRWSHLALDATRLAARIRRDLPWIGAGAQLTWLPTPFVRNHRAFLVGKLAGPAHTTPLVVAIEPGRDGLEAQALVTTADDASIVFGFTRSYFHVDCEAPEHVVGFLRSILPAKRLDELYTVVGHNRHGKREFYQTLHQLLALPDTRFEPIEGVPGMVMSAFMLKPMNAVFKVIRDRAAPPKQITRREVMEKYRYVFLTEHGGRLADSQEFEGLELPKRAFDPAVRADLEAHARDTVRDAGDHWVFSHLYTERRMIPLDVFIRRAPPEAAEAAVVDFGRAIKELAAINVFPGDMLAKNFGVTRHGRVVFYDYDEIAPLTDCTFRSIPQATSYEDEMAAEPWFSVRDSDVFPEEFERFLRFPAPLHDAFLRHHRDLFTAEFWNEIRRRVEEGIIVEPAPYGPEHLLS